MDEVETWLRASAVVIAPADPAGSDGRHCLLSYFAEIDRRFEGGFPAAVSPTEERAAMSPPQGMFLVARLHGRPVGCCGLRVINGELGEIKRMWVDAGVRGLGLGRRLLAAIEAEASRLGLARLRLDTNRALEQAQALYRSSGYIETAPFNAEPYSHFWFEKRLVF